MSRPGSFVRCATRMLAVGALLSACSGAPDLCNAPPSDYATCTTDAECATVKRGCYCGPQPVNGVAVKYAQAAQSCEDAERDACRLGCLNLFAVKTQDGQQGAPDAPVAVRCVSGTCTSYLP